jgi:pimeloyl-ACP methyl ester carboxylesterase
LYILLSCAFAGSAQDAPKPAIPKPVSTPHGRAPIIIIPGLTGSQLVNKDTNEVVWFKTSRSKDDDLRLPISPTLERNTDSLVHGDVIRELKIIKILPEIEIYERLVNALQERGGYKEGDWDAPMPDGDIDTFYVFPYDWRQDNARNAQKLIRDIDALKTKLGKPGLKFNIVAHSMGGLIARYAAMYGDAELTPRPKPTWAGAKDLDKIFLLGTPNEGSVSTISALMNGFSYFGGGINLPFVRNIDQFDVFTLPSSFQLLPFDDTLIVYNDRLEQIKLDVYNPRTWEEYDWAIWDSPGFKKKMSATEQANARRYFTVVLGRAELFQRALSANTSAKIPVSFYLMGADCKPTLNAMIVRQDLKKGKWIAQFDAASFTNSEGEKITSEQLKPLLYSVGDGVVTKRSLEAETLEAAGRENVLPVVSDLFQCEGHNKLVTNSDIQDRLLMLLAPETPAK